ncbi:MAG: hypothetical protein R2726_07840 [Acidimicrobiales bacterium]
MLGGGGLALLFAVPHLLYGEGLALGAGYDVATWLTEPGHTLGLIAALFLIRLAATCATLAGGGVGGLTHPSSSPARSSGGPSAWWSTTSRPPCSPWSASPPSSAPATARRWPA